MTANTHHQEEDALNFPRHRVLHPLLETRAVSLPSIVISAIDGVRGSHERSCCISHCNTGCFKWSADYVAVLHQLRVRRA